MSFSARLRRVARREKGVVTSDPEGVLATLQVAKRLIGESVGSGTNLTVMEAFDKAIPMASVKDPVRVWWSCVKVFIRHAEPDKSTLATLADAIAAQGKTNTYASKGPKP